MILKNIYVSCCIALLCIPDVMLSKVMITEIMYDPAGTDTGREWIEVYNDDSGSVDLANYRLFENGVAHTMKPFNAPAILLNAGVYAIVADNPEKFLVDYPTYNGLLIDSAFSLNNTGESLVFQTSDAVVESTVTYTTEWGGAGTGNSLQLSEGVWIPALPSVGVSNATVPVDESSADTNSASIASTSTSSSSTDSTSSSSNSSNTTIYKNSTHDSTVSVSTYKPKVKFEVSVGRDRYGFINTPLSFVPSHNQDTTSTMKFVWTSGDGDYVKNKKFEHTYMYEGEYNLVLNASYKGEQSVSRNKVFIRTPQITFRIINRGKLVDIMLENRGEFEVNVGGYVLVARGLTDNKKFEFPADTIIGASKNAVIPGEISKFKFDEIPAEVELLYPNGYELYTFYNTQQ